MEVDKKMRLSVLLFLAGAVSASVSESEIRIYMPRDVQIKAEQVRLGEVCVLRGNDDVVKKAEQINLGRLSTLSRKMVIGRAMILGRLRNSGFEDYSVKFTGADKVCASRQNQIIRGSRIKDCAESFLKSKVNDKSACKLEVLGNVADLILPDETENVELIPELIDSNTNRVRVRVTALADEKHVGKREVEFRFRYFCREAVAVRDIEPGEVITKENVEVTQKLSSSTESSDWQIPYGLVARRHIAANTVITPGSTGQPERRVLIKRNKHVAVVFERPGLSLTAVGKAMEDGRAGDYIKVRMQIKDSPRIIYAKVNDNGTVEPLM
jgi:flagella basal body P-ring formation protein FlgA